MGWGRLSATAMRACTAQGSSSLLAARQTPLASPWRRWLHRTARFAADAPPPLPPPSPAPAVAAAARPALASSSKSTSSGIGGWILASMGLATVAVAGVGVYVLGGTRRAL
jgi:hypothetical protein